MFSYGRDRTYVASDKWPQYCCRMLAHRNNKSDLCIVMLFRHIHTYKCTLIYQFAPYEYRVSSFTAMLLIASVFHIQPSSIRWSRLRHFLSVFSQPALFSMHVSSICNRTCVYYFTSSVMKFTLSIWRHMLHIRYRQQFLKFCNCLQVKCEGLYN